jgi:hypothetical protein
MLDMRATTGTPGATTTLANLSTIAVNDASAVAGVPIRNDAILALWGSNSLIANTICKNKLTSQDCIDPINGETTTLNTTSLQNQFYKMTFIPYRTGARIISQGTNTAQTATSQGFTLDMYTKNVGQCIPGSRWLANQVLVDQTLNADVAITWTSTGFAPATAIPNGKYALLGFDSSVMTEAHCIRFQHADFGFATPGIPTVGNPNSAILGFQKGMKDYLATNPYYQFVALGELLNVPCCPVFSVSNAGTGLNIQSLSAAATDTPVLTLNVAKVG